MDSKAEKEETRIPPFKLNRTVSYHCIYFSLSFPFLNVLFLLRTMADFASVRFNLDQLLVSHATLEIGWDVCAKTDDFF